MKSVRTRLLSTMLWMALSLALFSNQACSGESAVRPTLPEKSQMNLVVGADGKLTVLDAKGAPVPKCRLCSREMEEKYGQFCTKAPADAGICAGLTGVTVQSIQPVTFIDTHKNPLCRCSVIGGDAYCVPTGCNIR